MGRGDLNAYANGALSLRNLFIFPTGGVTRRAGLRFTDTVASSGRLIAFEFNTEQTYLLVLSDQQIKIYLDGESQATLSAPWHDAEINQVVWTQSADTLLLTHPEHPPKTLTRTSGGVWSLSDWAWFTEENIRHQPYYKFAPSDVTLQADGTSGTVTLTAGADVFFEDHEGDAPAPRRERA